jgi:hypothetical protein
MRLLAIAALAALALDAAPAAAQGRHPGPIGLVGTADVGGGGALAGRDADGTRGGLLETEVGLGYDLGQGLRPALDLLVALGPSAYLGFRPGFRYALLDAPFYFRGAVDLAAPGGSWRLRGVLGGAGLELRLTDLLSGYAGADVGIPVASQAGFLLLVRVGVGLRL